MTPIAEPVKGAVILAVASLLIAPILLAVLRGHRLEMGLDEIGLCSRVRRLDHCFGAGLTVLAIPPCRDRILRERHPAHYPCINSGRVLSGRRVRIMPITGSLSVCFLPVKPFFLGLSNAALTIEEF